MAIDALFLIVMMIAVLGLLGLLLVFWQRKTAIVAESAPEVKTVKSAEPPVSFSQKNRVEPTFNQLAFDEPLLFSLGLNGASPVMDTTATLKFPKTLLTPAGFDEHKTKKGFILLYIFAQPNKTFAGYELLQTLLAADLRYGKMNIFHYYDNTETVLFSVASAAEPGIFDVANIGAFSCLGLSLFMSPSSTDDPLSIFNKMLETAQELAEELDGQLCDEAHNPLTEESIAAYRHSLL